MDRMTKTVLWVTFLVLGVYFIWFFRDCALDETCRIVCGPVAYGLPPVAKGSNGGCYLQRAAKPIYANGVRAVP